MRKEHSIDPFVPEPMPLPHVPWGKGGRWPCAWISASPRPTTPGVVAYRCHFKQKQMATERIYVSADERYTLFLDGVQVGQGPERGDATHWPYETYDLELTAGDHMLVAIVWSLGNQAPYAQFSVAHGLLVCPLNSDMQPQIGTGQAEWQAKPVEGISFVLPPLYVGSMERVDAAAYPWGIESGEGSAWKLAAQSEVAAPAHWLQAPQNRHALVPGILPAMLSCPVDGAGVRHIDDVTCTAQGDVKAAASGTPILASNNRADEAGAWAELLASSSELNIPAHTVRRVLIDLDDYYCAYPSLTVSGGAGSVLQLEWAEALYSPPTDAEMEARPKSRLGAKGNRNEIEGKLWCGQGDVLVTDGGARRRLRPLWWRAGRYVMLSIATGETPLTINALTFSETRYPLEQESRFDAPMPPAFTRAWPIMLRGLQMCAHETYMDCPYYEQLMYVGDTRLEALTTFVLTADSRLPLKALTLFDHSRMLSGLTQSRYPSRETQVIPTFSLWWICEAHDYAWWRDDPDTVTGLLPGVRSVVNAFESYMDEEGLIRHPRGWNFVDWVWDENWHCGVPDDRGHGANAPLQWQFVLALQAAAELEQHFGSSHLSAHCSVLVERARAAAERFWDEGRSLYANDLDRTHFSEHANCLALVSGALDTTRARRLANSLFSEKLPRASIYFSHYYFEAARMARRPDILFARLEEWHDLPDQGLRTTRESPEPSRSDCHGWGAHPIFLAFATILGVRPAAPGFRKVSIEPMLGDLPEASGTIPHPAGTLDVSIVMDQGTPVATVKAPGGIDVELAPGIRSRQSSHSERDRM